MGRFLSFFVFELQLTYEDPSVRARGLIHERPPGVPRTRRLPFPPLELDFRPKHLVRLVLRIGRPQVDSLQKLTSLSSPGVLLVVRCEPELSEGFLTDIHPFHNFYLLKSMLSGF